ncbi:ribonuclease E/G [Cucumibacter marinus]|uniref:ribonuclease E/G n=1 Tax=Cucumibacter marinus TaxID=1121252 RepID=UPI000412219F|nr:ribonuclease E/G [Cucumibacter marinus]
MASKKMLVDAIHPEETRVVVTSGNRLEEFDFESATRRQLRGNIYLAKVTRVEPSLQAAFVDYGGNRHGFLAFSEIHPDYYQIPVADREALLRDQAEEDAAQAAEDDAEARKPSRRRRRRKPQADNAAASGEADPSVSEEAAESAADDADASPREASDDVDENGSDENGEAAEDSIEQLGSDDALEEVPQRRQGRAKKYKIQEVIKRRQVLLVQVVKEERGNKGAALTTYLSLAGRYSVLMPNTARGGGISRKITSAADRKRLKDIAGGLDVPEGMGVILRTAGASRTKAEVKRDFEYLMRLWENVRSLTLESTAPMLVYEEGSLIKRSIRDLYNKDIGEVIVAGDAAYREAKDFMRMIMPSHAKHVQPYKDDQPVFSRFGIESQLDSMFSPRVTLPSGGYIIINPTEALVSIDVNSGKSTKEHNIEDTALQTNLEAAEEISRQLRLRDLAGLIVIDFIDMEEKRNNRTVERKLKDCLKHDRARIQIGRISHFGLMEMSRQRIRFGVLESSTQPCPHCEGTGLIRSVESLALMVMRAVEDHVRRKPGQSICVNVPAEVALYILNAKRQLLSELEQRFGLAIQVSAQPDLGASQYNIERLDITAPEAIVSHVRLDSGVMDAPEREEEEQQEQQEKLDDNAGGRNKRRRRRRRGGEDEAEANSEADSAQAQEDKSEARSQGDEDDDDENQPRKRRRRGRRGGRRNRRGNEGNEANSDGNAQTEAVGSSEKEDAGDNAPGNDGEDASSEDASFNEAGAETVNAAAADAEPAETVSDAEAVAAVEKAGSAETSEEKPAKKPRRRRSKKTDDAEKVETAAQDLEGDSDGAEKSEKADDAPVPVAEDNSAEDSSAEDSPVEDKEPAMADADASEDKPSRRKAAAPESDEIIVTSTSGSSAEKPKRGWWQRG